MAYVSHPRKHDINSSLDHVKDRLDLNEMLTLPTTGKIVMGIGSIYETETYFKWNETTRMFNLGRGLDINGNLYLAGESSIKGGELANDSLSLFPSRTTNTPSFTFEGETSAGFILDTNKTEEVYISDNAYTPTAFFKFNHSDNPTTTPHHWIIGNDTTTNTMDLNAYVNFVYAHNLYAGDTTSDYLNITPKGFIYLYGDARQAREILNPASTLYGNSATYNGISCNAAGASVINDIYQAKTLSGGGGWTGGAEAFITGFKIPQDYDESINEIDIILNYTSDVTSGAAYIGVGLVVAGTSYTGTPTYLTQTIPAPATAWDRATYSFDFTGISPARGNEIGIVVYRNPNDTNDTMNSNAYVTGVSMEYVANQIGGSI